jgi:hypothetical protein
MNYILKRKNFREYVNYVEQFPAFVTAVQDEKKIPWSESASELYRPSDRRLSAK